MTVPGYALSPGLVLHRLPDGGFVTLCRVRITGYWGQGDHVRAYAKSECGQCRKASR